MAAALAVSPVAVVSLAQVSVPKCRLVWSLCRGRLVVLEFFLNFAPFCGAKRGTCSGAARLPFGWRGVPSFGYDLAWSAGPGAGSLLPKTAFEKWSFRGAPANRRVGNAPDTAALRLPMRQLCRRSPKRPTFNRVFLLQRVAALESGRGGLVGKGSKHTHAKLEASRPTARPRDGRPKSANFGSPFSTLVRFPWPNRLTHTYPLDWPR